MKFLVIILLGFTLPGKSTEIYAHNTALKCSVIDTAIFNYYPLKTGNKWVWNVFRTFSPGSGYEKAFVESTLIFDNHLYYKIRGDTYLFYLNQYSTYINYLRIDSVTGNFYTLYLSSNDTSVCLTDSLNTPINDSAYTYCYDNPGPGTWYKHTRSTYNIFSQIFISEIFSWSNYFEAGGYHTFARNIGMVHSRYQAVMSTTEKTLRGCVINNTLYGDTTFVLGINLLNTEIPEKFELSQNYPNPFNPVTKIKFAISGTTAAQTFLSVFDALGREVTVLVNQQLQPGLYESDWDASVYPSGVYYYRIAIHSDKLAVETFQQVVFTETRKMVLLK